MWSDETIQERIDVVIAKRAEEGQGGEGATTGGEQLTPVRESLRLRNLPTRQADVAGGETAADGAGAPELSVSAALTRRAWRDPRPAWQSGRLAPTDTLLNMNAVRALNDAGAEGEAEGTAEAGVPARPFPLSFPAMARTADRVPEIYLQPPMRAAGRRMLTTRSQKVRAAEAQRQAEARSPE